MLKNIKYETNDVNEIFIDIAEEIKNGWKLYSFSMPCIEHSLICRPGLSCRPEIAMEVSFSKEF